MTTREQRDKLRELEATATPGPVSLDPHFQCYIWGPNCQMVADDGMDEDGTLTRMRGVGANLPLATNGALLVAARNSIRDLCDQVDALEAAIAAAPHGRGCGIGQRFHLPGFAHYETDAGDPCPEYHYSTRPCNCWKSRIGGAR